MTAPILPPVADWLSDDPVTWVDPPTPIKCPDGTGLKPTTGPTTLQSHREELQRRREEIIRHPGPYLECSPTGSGKSHADLHAIQLINALPNAGYRLGAIVLPTHSNGAEVVEDFQRAGFNAVAFPPIRFADSKSKCPTCPQEGSPRHDCRKCFGTGWIDQFRNCHNQPDAERAMNMGLSVATSACLGCPLADMCRQSGYLADIERAESAEVSVLTHTRLSITGFEATSGCPYVSIHEDAVNLLRPTVTMNTTDLEAARRLVDTILADPKWLRWLASGNTTRKQKRRQRIFDFLHHMIKVIEHIQASVQAAKRSCRINLPAGPGKKAQGVDWVLFAAAESYGITFEGSPLRLLLSAAAGDLFALGVTVAKAPGKDGQPDQFRRRLVGVWRNQPSPASTTLFNDATATAQTLQDLIGRQVQDVTPTGHLELQHEALQYTSDLTAGQSAKTVQNVTRGIMASYPDRRRIGIICHSKHKSAFSKLGSPFQERIVKTAYFWSGEERSSNDWFRECDLLIIAGTPRIRPEVVEQRLIQLGHFDALGESPGWGKVHWTGATASGRPVAVTGLGYSHPVWRDAHRGLVVACLQQSVGRGRGLLEDGIPVVVLSSEECGLTIADGIKAPELSGTEAAVYTSLLDSALASPQAESSKQKATQNDRIAHETLYIIIEKHARFAGIGSAAIAERTGLALRTVQHSLRQLAEFNVCHKTGSGPATLWFPGTHPIPSTPPAVPPAPAPSPLSPPATSDMKGPQ